MYGRSDSACGAKWRALSACAGRPPLALFCMAIPQYNVFLILSKDPRLYPTLKVRYGHILPISCGTKAIVMSQTPKCLFFSLAKLILAG